MTSRGQVTIPEAIPADAPQTALTLELGTLASADAMLEESKLGDRGGVEASREDRVASVGAYRWVVVVGDGGSGASVDMVEADFEDSNQQVELPSTMKQCKLSRAKEHTCRRPLKVGRLPGSSACGSPAALERDNG